MDATDSRRLLRFTSPAYWIPPLGLAMALLLSGCATPTASDLSRTVIMQPDAEDDLGGSFIESGDIRTIANQMTASLLSLPEVSARENTVIIAVSPVRNSTRYVIDKEIFTKRLRLEMNRVSEGRVRFISQGMGQAVRSQILDDRTDAQWENLVNQAATALLEASFVKKADQPLRMAVSPVKNTNLAGVNAESFTALLRAKISEKADGKIEFLARDASGKVMEQILDEKDLKDQGLVSSGAQKELLGVDYFLTGEFIGKSMMVSKTKEVRETSVGVSQDDPGVVEGTVSTTEKAPNVTKYLEIKVVNAETGAVAFNKLVKLEDKMSSGLGRAEFILTGELSALSKAAEGGDRSDYVMMSFQLVDPITNEIIWEDAYETKRRTNVSVIYK